VSIRLHAELARRLSGGERQVQRELPTGSSIDDLLALLKVPADLGVIVGRNGTLAERSATLTDGDKIELMTAMEGG